MASITADRDYQPGDLIYSEKAFAKVLCREFKDEYCERCALRSTDLKSCKKCRAVKYCKRACQRNDWPDHHLECRHLKNLPENLDYVRLLGRVILQIKGKDWKKIKKNILGKEVSFDDINNCSFRDTTDHMEILRLKEVKDQLTRYIGDGNVPDEGDLLKIMNKVDVIPHFDPHGAVVALSFFFGPPLFDVECIPNANMDVVQLKTVKIWANKKIQKLEKISISTNSVLDVWSNSEKQKICKCTDCSLPYGESILSKIIDDKRAFSVIKSTKYCFDLLQSLSDLGTIAYLKELCVDELLNEQKGILGDTHVLHLKTLSLKVGALQKSGNLPEKLETLLELEKLMKTVFGAYYSEMKPIYLSLFLLHTRLGNVLEASIYSAKLKRLQAHESNT